MNKNDYKHEIRLVVLIKRRKLIEDKLVEIKKDQISHSKKMESLKSTALIPGEPEFKTEFNLLNMLLVKIPKHVDLRLILNVKPLQPRHTVALQQLHSELFPIRYDPKFFEVACSTESGFFDTQSFWDFFDSSHNNTRDVDWYENEIMAFGVFLPRTYVSFFRRTGEYAIDKYLEFLVKDADYSEFDDPLTESLLYDHECDEFMIGFVTLLINLEETNNLISGDDYNILRTFYTSQLEETERRIRSSIRINESLLGDSFYLFLYNQLYNNELIMEYVRNFNIKNAKSVYILSTGITLGLRKRMLGTHVILFVQLLVYYVNYNVYVYENSYYQLTTRRNMSVMRNYYNSKFIRMRDMYVYYTHVLNLGNVPVTMANFITKVNEVNKNGTENSNVAADLNSLNASNSNVNKDVAVAKGRINDVYSKMPLVIYLHTIYYNEYATRMYEHLNFYRIKSIPDYYNINNKRYDANFLAHYLCM
ncbi:conserved hypothetical protein [Theileria orientalis strain Shintoku]|uniref:histone acetyltransferase n=1 Tax=Theileria orientalis strain Shintoku TaxID=869250 RepID=J4C7K9_THEOR|nr:conserved hypothetical protein [Theileria orientalis strain Shintoku]BAM39218.1 conserved hypothetical protein [Theileria orientalis strain Shintoku]|eukprot:XP_009689519.1 conserved hypothetical protein [Theileria orientalis strain Shintoku]